MKGYNISRRAMIGTSLLALCSLSPIKAMAASANDGLASMADETEGLIQQLKRLPESYVGFNIDTDVLEVCRPINFYEAKDGSLSLLREECPVLGTDGLLRFFSYQQNGDTLATTALVNEINSALVPGEAFAIVYDDCSCYLAHEDGTLSLLGESVLTVPERNHIDEISDASVLRGVSPEPIFCEESLTVPSVAQPFSSLGVSFVSQNPPSYMCWAASVACIANYKRGGSRTAKSVAQGYYGAANYNRSLKHSLLGPVLSNNGVSGYAHVSWLTDAKLDQNFSAGYPIVGTLTHANGDHDVVVRGRLVSQLYVMDPEFGFTTATKVGSAYTYVSGYSGVSLRTTGAAAYYR